MAPDFVLPADDVFRFVELRLHFHDHRRAVRLPREFVVAHPLQLDRSAVGGARQQRGVAGGVICAVVAVAAGAFYMGAGHVGNGGLERLRQISAQRKHALAVRPDLILAVFELRHCSRRADGAMRLKRARILGFDAGDLAAAADGGRDRFDD